MSRDRDWWREQAFAEVEKRKAAEGALLALVQSIPTSALIHAAEQTKATLRDIEADLAERNGGDS